MLMNFHCVSVSMTLLMSPVSLLMSPYWYAQNVFVKNVVSWSVVVMNSAAMRESTYVLKTGSTASLL